MIGKIVSHYRVIDRLGGGMGVVCEADDIEETPKTRSMRKAQKSSDSHNL